MRKKLSGPRFLGPYKVTRVASGGNYELVSPSGAKLRRSYPLDQLRLIADSVAADLWSQAVTDENDIVYTADRILDHRSTVRGGYEYLVRWDGFSSEFDSWEPAANILTPDIISRYWGMGYDEAQQSPALLRVPAMEFLPCAPVETTVGLPSHGPAPPDSV